MAVAAVKGNELARRPIILIGKLLHVKIHRTHRCEHVTERSGLRSEVASSPVFTSKRKLYDRANTSCNAKCNVPVLQQDLGKAQGPTEQRRHLRPGRRRRRGSMSNLSSMRTPRGHLTPPLRKHHQKIVRSHQCYI